jgi:hypothetical protein
MINCGNCRFGGKNCQSILNFSIKADKCTIVRNTGYESWNIALYVVQLFVIIT